MKKLQKWFANDCANVSIVTGAVSGALVVLDFDHEAAEVFPEWMNEVGLLSEKLPIAKTGKGMHVYVRVVLFVRPRGACVEVRMVVYVCA